MKEDQTRLGKCNSIVFPHKLFKIYMTIDSKNVRLVEVSMYVDIINGDYNTKRGKAKET